MNINNPNNTNSNNYNATNLTCNPPIDEKYYRSNSQNKNVKNISRNTPESYTNSINNSNRTNEGYQKSARIKNSNNENIYINEFLVDKRKSNSPSIIVNNNINIPHSNNLKASSNDKNSVSFTLLKAKPLNKDAVNYNRYNNLNNKTSLNKKYQVNSINRINYNHPQNIKDNKELKEKQLKAAINNTSQISNIKSDNTFNNISNEFAIDRKKSKN